MFPSPSWYLLFVEDYTATFVRLLYGFATATFLWAIPQREALYCVDKQSGFQAYKQLKSTPMPHHEGT